MSAIPNAVTQLVAENREVSAPSPAQREEAIRASVLAKLGRPVRLLKVAVLPLWGNNFRVNVWTGEGASADAIPNSYFVTADERGGILRSEPPIQKQY
ncbi:hypothetical protein J8F10_36115 [Gemmata sp. G18]|uniref:PepSY domain-containing protein n=1 Tax=Gemmata palustris TaxID=2822762 RepID=A0ABS5C3X9_9BACT|nr:hypothetical protein [Gemmata palustris]MBP3960682.1 hypothetical protein [Gemmata palustris]